MAKTEVPALWLHTLHLTAASSRCAMSTDHILL